MLKQYLHSTLPVWHCFGKRVKLDVGYRMMCSKEGPARRQHYVAEKAFFALLTPCVALQAI